MVIVSASPLYDVSIKLTARWTNLVQGDAIYDESRQLAGSGDATLLKLFTLSRPWAIWVPDIVELDTSISQEKANSSISYMYIYGISLAAARFENSEE